MILVGNQRGNGRELAQHLLKEENERVIVHDLRGFVADSLDGAFQESQAISRATKCQQHLFSMSFNPPKGAVVDEATFEDAINRAEKRLGLKGQPRAVVFHEKLGRDGEIRRHAHAVWCRIDADKMRAIQMSHSRQKMQSLARELYVEHGWEMPRGFVSKDFADPMNYSLAEWQQAKRARQDPERLKAMFQECWATTDSQSAFGHALRERGFVLARGDRRGVVAVDCEGEVYAVARWVGLKTKQIKQRVDDPEALPDVRTAHAQASDTTSQRMKTLHGETRRKARTDLAAFGPLKQALLDAHKRAKEMQRAQHEHRAETEAAARSARFRKGWRGLLDRVTGAHGKIQSQNRAEIACNTARDADEVTRLADRQAAEQSALASAYDEVRTTAKSDLQELRKDFRRITQQVNNNEDAPEAPPRRRRRRRQNRSGPS